MAENYFLNACRLQAVERIPVWFMRQAGRHLPEYRELRKRYGMLELCGNPELAAEVTLQPVRRYGVDAAIIFADILLLLPPLGVDFEFEPGRGPRIDSPIRSAADIERLADFEPREELAFVMEALRLVAAELSPTQALIGFAGAPFTVASYMIEGGYSRHFSNTKALMYQEPFAWHALMSRVAAVTARYLAAQVEAGAQAIQLFDSWAGCLSPSDYETYVLPHTSAVFEALKAESVPTIHFATGTAGFLRLQQAAGGTVQSIDWRMRLEEARRQLGPDVALQGNLDPVALLSAGDTLWARVDDILRQGAGAPGFIFNLGHGVLPPTDPETVQSVVDRVHAWQPAIEAGLGSR